MTSYSTDPDITELRRLAEGAGSFEERVMAELAVRDHDAAEDGREARARRARRVALHRVGRGR